MISSTHARPLTAVEYLSLNDFLMARVNREPQLMRCDDGIVDTCMLHGLLTAVLSSPVVVPRSSWWQAIWGSYPPDWEEPHVSITGGPAWLPDRRAITRLILRLKRQAFIALTSPEALLEPLYGVFSGKGDTSPVWVTWCEGYRQGVRLTRSRWVSDEGEIKVLLEPILAFTRASRYRAMTLDPAAHRALGNQIEPNVRALFAYWAARREAADPIQLAYPAARPVGRNTPCPCGSGIKYKRCCLRGQVREA